MTVHDFAIDRQSSMMFYDHNGNLVSVDYEYITPELAQNLLDRNIETNRNINRVNLDKVKTALTEEAFIFNGDTIKITSEEELCDGQHRLMAIVETGIGCWMLVVRGVTTEAMDTIDQNLTRTVAQMLHIRGRNVSNATLAIATQRILLLSDENVDRRMASRDRRRLAEIVWDNHEELAKWTAWGKSVLNSSDIFYVKETNPLAKRRANGKRIQAATPSTLAASAVIMARKANEDALKAFWEAVIEGVPRDFSFNDQRLVLASKALRNFLTTTQPMVINNNSSGHLMVAYDTAIRVYNRWRNDEEVGRVGISRNADQIKHQDHLTRPVCF